MKFHSIVVTSLHDYRANPWLALPALVGFFVSLVSGIVIFALIHHCDLQTTIDSCAVTAGEYSVVASAIQSFVGLFLVLGSVSMTGQVVLGNHASLGGWLRGIKLHFAKVFIVLLVFGAVGLAIAFTEEVEYGILVVPGVFAHIQNADFATEFIRVEALTRLAWGGLMGWLESFLSLFSSLCLASAVLHRIRLRESVRAGLRIINHNRGFCFRYVVLLWAVGFALRLLSSSLSMLGITQPTLGGSSPMSIVSDLAGTFISPLWYLITFTFYAEVKGGRTPIP